MPDSLYWSVVEINDLSNYCRKRRLHYVGTFENYHLIFWYDKHLPNINGEYVKKTLN